MGWCVSAPVQQHADKPGMMTEFVKLFKPYEQHMQISTHALLVVEGDCLAIFIIYIPTFLRGFWHFEPFPKKIRVKRCSRVKQSLCLCRSGEAWLSGSTEPMSQQERNTNLWVSLDQIDGRWVGHCDTVWKSQWGRRGGPWTDPRGPDFKALYRGDGKLLLSVTDCSSLSSTHIFSLRQIESDDFFRHSF